MGSQAHREGTIERGTVALQSSPHLIFIGGGLANSLIALRLAALRPDVDWTILESEAELGGNHTWSFHQTDLTPEQNRWIAPLVETTWPEYEVRFPRFGRRLPFGYASASADKLRAAMAPHASRVMTKARVVSTEPCRVTLDDGRTFEADGVIDGRGHRPSPHMRVAYQKFLGQEVVTAQPHGLMRPIVMDATVPQRDGYRFIYVLPFGPDRLLIEDTYYSSRADLDPVATRGLIGLYARQQGWIIRDILREETGVLPIALSGDIEALWSDAEGVARSGLRAALFHPTTGYSLPDAARLADTIASAPDLSAPALFALTRAHSIGHWRRAGFYRLLDRLMFEAAEPDERYRLFARFYRLSPGLMTRFYAGRSTLLDKIRLLSGKPPVPLGRAIRCMPERSVAVVR